MSRMATSFNESIGDARFYVILTGLRKPNFNGGCLQKSNFFLLFLFLTFDKGLLNKFVDFTCGGRLMHTDFHDSNPVKHFLYLDDATFTGNQVK